MLDRFLIFTRAGVVLWSLTLLPPSPDALCATTAAVNGLVRDVLLPARGGAVGSGATAGGAGAGSSVDTPDFTLHWAVDPGTDCVFVAVVPRQFSPLVTYVGTLLASVRGRRLPVIRLNAVLGGERPEAALIRELREELGIEVSESCLAPFVFASHAYDSFHLLMPLYLCRRWNGVVAAREHAALAWVRPNQLSDYPMPPADEPLVAWLRDLL
jgi:hypothetical protein